MSESNIIDKLPNEMVMKIFGHLDSRSLDNAVLTCKRWKERIEELCPWSWKIDLKVVSITKWMEFSQTTKRRCNKLAIRTLESTDDILGNVVEIMKIHGSEVVELFVHQCYWNVEYFGMVMKHLPKLKHLIVMGTELYTTVKDVELPELSTLRTVQLVGSRGFGLIECLAKSSLDTVQIRDCGLSPKSVKDFLTSQKGLKTLALRFENSSFGEILEILDDTLPFKLTNLSLRFEERLNMDKFTNLTKFMDTQSQTVKSLESRGKFSNSYYETVLSKFCNLKSLLIKISDLPMDPTFYDRFQAKNVTTLILVDWKHSVLLNERCPLFFKNFIRCVPNITDLTVNVYYCHDVMRFLSNNLKHVEKLSIQDIIAYDRCYAIQFPKLHTLNIKEFELDSSWYEFVKNNTQLRDLTVNIIRNDSADWMTNPIEHIRKFIRSIEPLKLQKLSIGKRYPTIPIVQSTRRLFNELPFRDDHSFNHWMDQEFWSDEKCFGSLLDKWIYDGLNCDHDDHCKHPFTFTNYLKDYLENVFVVLENDLKVYEKMAVTVWEFDTPFPHCGKY